LKNPRIEVLPAIRRVVPFRDLAAWTEAAAGFQKTDGLTEEPQSWRKTNHEPAPSA